MTGRDWREGTDTRRSTFTLVAILAGAAALRFIGLGAGVPYAVGVDEPEIMNRAVGMMHSGNLHPHFYDYPSLYIYVQLAVACGRFMVGAVAGEWRSLGETAITDFYVWGRAVTATLGTLTVLLVYHIGLRWGTRAALLGAALLSVMPLHVRESHYVLTDVPATFFVALTWLLALRAHEQPRAATFAWAGMAAGFATATKYPAGLALLLPLAAVWMTPRTQPSRLAASLAVVGAAGAAFLLAAPYTVLDLPAFLNGFARLMAYYTVDRLQEPAWLLYVKHLRNSLQWPAIALSAAGLVIGLTRTVRGPDRVRWALLVTFPLLYFWFISRHTLVFGRYLIPLVPFVCLLTATGIVSAMGGLRRSAIPRSVRTGVLALLVLAAWLPPALVSIDFTRTVRKPGTPALAYAWITTHVPGDSDLVIESTALVLRHERAIRSRNIRELREATYDDYLQSGVDYLVASSQSYGRYMDAPHLFPREYAEYMRLFGLSRELARFTPSAEHPGPELRILQLRD